MVDFTYIERTAFILLSVSVAIGAMVRILFPDYYLLPDSVLVALMGLIVVAGTKQLVTKPNYSGTEKRITLGRQYPDAISGARRGSYSSSSRLEACNYQIKYTETTDDPSRFRDFVWANTKANCKFKLLDSDGEVVDAAVIEDGSVMFPMEDK